MAGNIAESFDKMIGGASLESSKHGLQTNWLRDFLGWLPDSVVAIAYLLLTTIVAVAVFRLLRALAQRTLKRRPVVLSILQRASAPAQYAVIVLAAALIAPALPLDKGTTDILNRVLAAAFVLLSGWIAAFASNLAIDHYMTRFKTDVEDNLMARKALTQIHVLKRSVTVLIGVVTLALALMTFDAVRQYGISLFASAGIAGLAVGMAAKPLLSNFIAGLQLAVTQPIRIDDAVVIQGEWGWIEEMTSTYVVVRLWDARRLIVPLSYFLENTFQNWTRTSATIIGTVLLYVDYTADIEAIRAKLLELVKLDKKWDGSVANLQVTDLTDHTVELRVLVSAKNSSLVWDLRCEMREQLLAFLRQEHPEFLPRNRASLDLTGMVSPAR